MRLFDAAIDIPLSTDLMRNASELAWQLDRKGHVLPLSDLVIAACAKQIGAVVVSEDGHFRRIPGVKVRAALPSMDLL